ncbi:amino acid adenylation domain-containing protein [Streptomyces sp. NPDC019937]|uniref:amino acid adenylation domain-containing protein n=1 Tax=Streptomyces sp. NPDC019937 TaxID=3154787 RepID=UPI0033E385B5
MSPSLEDRIAALPAHLREQLLRRMAGASAPGGDGGPAEDETATEPAIATVPRTGPLPMSFSQQRLWFLHELEPEAVGYNSCFGLRLTGELDAGALRRAITGVMRRHESLRTTFDTVDGTPVQIPHDTCDVPFERVDLSGFEAPERSAELDRAVARDVARPFDLRTGPLLRVLLVRLAEREHILVLTLHHINHDGWSMSVFTREFGELYRAEREGREAALAPVPLQYADFAVWQRAQLSRDALARSLEYWKERLAGLTPLELPTDRPRPPVRTSAGDVESFDVAAGVADALRAVSQRCGATLFMTLTTAVQALLARWTGQSDVAVATPVAGRKHPGLEEVVGFFLNTLVLRAQVEPGLTFAELLTRGSESVLDAFEHEDVPFEQVVDAVQPQRDAGRMPLAQVLVVLQNAPEARLELSGLNVEQHRLPQASTGFDLVLGFEERADGSLGVDVEYSGDLFEAATVRRLCGHLVTLLGSIAATPDRPVAELALLTDDEHRRLTTEWSRTPAPDIDDVCVHELVARRAAEHPGAVAVECGGQALTYGELDARAGELAERLTGLGVTPGSVVGVCLDRGPDLVVATLAALKAGAAFLPLNVTSPPARRALMLEETEAPVVLTQRSLLGEFADAASRTVAVDEPWPGSGTGDATGAPRVTPEALAYVIYTSGSTGVPKGVLLGHRGLVNMVTACARRFRLGVGSRVLQLSSLSFDGAVWETFVALTSGATLCLPESGADAIGPGLVAGLAKGGPVLMSLPPAALAALEPADLAAGSTVLAVGDRCPVELARAWSARHRFVNGYGPTEATIGATFFEGEIPADAVRLPIGKPIAGVEVYVLDEALRPAPVGVTGELYIGGRGVAQGYLGRPDLTDQRFVPHPFTDDPAARLYRTGDVGAWLPGGDIDFRGRTDDQVKIRGFRIELGEIETALARVPGVDQACVLALDHGRRKQLVGYVVPAAGTEAEPGRLRDELAAVLPGFMVPSAFAVLDRLPLTTHGKVDRSALATVPVTARQEHVAPRTETEKSLAGIFRTVLGVERVGMYDGFFDLGGDSILSTQVVSRARRAGMDLTVKELFQHKTVAQLAAVVRPLDGAGAGEDERQETGPVPLTPVQHWFFGTHTVNPHHFNQSVMLALSPDTDATALRAALEAIVGHHDALRLRFTRGDGGWAQEVTASAEGRWHFARLDLFDLPDGQARDRVDEAVLACQTSLDITDGPLLRALLIDPGKGRPPQLFLTAHHLAVDGVSWRVLLDDLRIAYGQLAAGKPADLGPRSTSFAQWARRLNEFTATGGFDGEADHWRAATAHTAPVPEPGPAGNVRTVRGQLSTEDTDALLRRVPGVYRARINDVLLAALGRALTAWTGQERTLIDLEGHGREDLFEGVDLSRTVGWFTAAHPVALAVPGDAPMPSAVRTVKRQLRAVPRNGIGYGALRHLGADRPGGAPMEPVRPLVGFNYLGQWGSGFTGNELVTGYLPHGGREHEPAERRVYPLDVVGSVENGRLEFGCAYSPGQYPEESITALLTGMLDGLRELVRETT